MLTFLLPATMLGWFSGSAAESWREYWLGEDDGGIPWWVILAVTLIVGWVVVAVAGFTTGAARKGGVLYRLGSGVIELGQQVVSIPLAVVGVKA